MKTQWLILSLAALSLTSCGKSAKVKAMESFGLLGTWATDCSKAASHDNVFVTFTAATFATDLGADTARLEIIPKPHRIRSAEILSDTKLRLVTSVSNVKWNEASGRPHPTGSVPDTVNTIVIVKDASGRIREMQDTSANAQAERMVVTDGWNISPAGQRTTETQAKERCHS